MPRLGLEPSAIVVGHGPNEARAALDLARSGISVTLVTEKDGLASNGEGSSATPDLLQAVRHPRVKLLTGASVRSVEPLAAVSHPDDVPGLRVKLHQLPRYVDPSRCTACGACTEICPVYIPGRGGSATDGGHRAIYRVGVPTYFAIDKAGTAPCRHACPIDQRAQGYVALVRAGNFAEAYRTIKRENPFPSVCGRVCNHRCEDICTRSDIDEPVAVMALKRFVSDWAADAGIEIDAVGGSQSGFRVAVVGAGPAGLTAARDLNQMGHDVVAFEALSVPGGMMRVGIPAFRLPRERLQLEVDEIIDSGVELRTNTRVDDVNLLFDQGFDAVVLAVGLHTSRRLAIPGVEDDGDAPRHVPSVMGAIEFLRRINLGERPDWRGRKVVVVGGGSTAMDAARVARRLGAAVQVVYRRSGVEMPAHDNEVRDAEDEGVQMLFLTNPERFIRSDGRLIGVECLRMELGEPDDSGRRRPQPIAGSHLRLAADNVLLAIGQTSDLPYLGADASSEERTGVVHHDTETLMSTRPGLFVAGDVAGTAGFVVDAIASGSKVARSVDRYLRGDLGTAEPSRMPKTELDEVEVAWRLTTAAPRATARVHRRSVVPETLWQDFSETENGLTAAQAMAEAARCLSCGLCSECLACVQVCPATAINYDCSDRWIDLETSACLFGNEGANAATISGCDAVFRAQGDAGMVQAVSQVAEFLGASRVSELSVIAAPAYSSPTRLSGNGKPKLGVFLCRCGGEIDRVVDLGSVGERMEQIPGVALVKTVDFACHPGGAETIDADIAAWDLDGAVLAACSCCALDQICDSCTTQRMRCKEQLGVWSKTARIPIGFVNVREQCAFVHADAPLAATLKAGDMIAASSAVLLGSEDPNRAISSRDDGSRSRIPITALVDPIRCRGCEDCEIACGLDAILVAGSNGQKLAKVDASLCLGCGVCVAACSSAAISAGDASDAQLDAMLAAMDVSDKTVVFACNWGAYSAVEAASIDRLEYSPSVRIIRVMCAGRVHEGLLLKAFSRGAERVMLLACGHTGEVSLCHYQTGADRSQSVVQRTRELLHLLGFDANRLGWAEMRPGDGDGFVSAIQEFIGASKRVAQGRS